MSMPGRMRTRVRLALACVAILTARSGAGATETSDLCTSNPCIVSGAHTVDVGSDLDFGAGIDLRLDPTATLTIGPGASPRTMALRAGAVTLEAGARILGGATASDLTVAAVAGDLKVQRTGATSALIDLSASEGGVATLEATGKVTVHGTIDVQGEGRDAQGGSIEIDADGAVNVSGSLLAAATGSGSGGGQVAIHAGSELTSSGTISTTGGDFGAGDVELFAATGDVSVTGTIEMGGGSPEGFGGAIAVTAPAGAVELGAALTARGASGAAEACGDGGSIDIDASGDVVLSGSSDLSGGRHCLGGGITVNAGGDVTQLVSSTITATALGAFGGGGEVDVTAVGDVTLSRIDLTSPGAAGSVLVVAQSRVVVADRIDVNGSGANGVAGTSDLTGCEVEIASTGRLSALGLGGGGAGVNVLRAGGAMTIAGMLEAEETNELRYLTVLPVVTGTVAPSATVLQDPGVPPCPVVPSCGNGAIEGDEVCDDGNLDSCDGCRADCTRRDDVCGDTVAECGEACDDGNAIDGDGCESTCELSPLEGVRLPGEPRATAGCLAEWSLGPWVAVDSESGFATGRQECIDGDPACDRDGSENGACTFEVEACLGAPDPVLPACAPSSIDFVKLRQPRSIGGDAVDTANAGALIDALAALGVTVREGAQVVSPGTPVSTPDACTAPIELQVPLVAGAAATRRISIAARDTQGLSMTTNLLRLRCKPRPERCGDGIVQSGEECDLGAENGVPGSRCSASCQMLPSEVRIPGGSASRALDCPLEWSADLDPDGMRTDRRGIPTYVQSCRDGDASCDLDPTPGTCRIRLWGCLGGADARLGCAAASVSSVEILGPRANAPTAFERDARAAFAAALAGLGFPAGPGETCTRPFEVDVPVGPARLTLRAQTVFGSGSQIDSDVLVLRCDR